MKKIISLILVIMLLFTGCSLSSGDKTQNKSGKDSAELKGTNETSTNSVDIDITESKYVTYANEIYTNPTKYIGKVVRLQGMFTYEDYETKKYYYVYRVGPGCCGNDGAMCGFEFTTDGDYPDYTPLETDTNDEHPWIEVVGTLETYKEGSATYITLSNATVTVIPDSQRGADVVSL